MLKRSLGWGALICIITDKTEKYQQLMEKEDFIAFNISYGGTANEDKRDHFTEKSTMREMPI